ncbi:sirohydrochlorin chelatase [Nocardia takedensis]|uniref:sirohydrochlorin chelatase n=1 Tax=Nocardia takedensis TaxID=259390 RepID=UPI000A0428CF|nr:sirohydrochlorin chelatase [Nocardia takedensis]
MSASPRATALASTVAVSARGVAAPARGVAAPAQGGGAPALIAVAHGSRDPRSAATMAAVVAEIATARPDLDVRLAFLDLSVPSVDQVVDEIAACGHTHAVVVPLLLGSAFHARVDLPALLEAARARHPRVRLTQADVLGPDPRLVSALRDRVAISASPAPTGVLVAAVGSSSAAANARTERVARRLGALTGWATEICYATAEPTIETARERLRARGIDRPVVASWFLAPGLLTDRLRAAAPDLVHAEVIGAHRAVVEIVGDRYDAARTDPLALTA